MTTVGYLSTGGIKGAVAETAEEVYGDLTDAQKIVAGGIPPAREPR